MGEGKCLRDTKGAGGEVEMALRVMGLPRESLGSTSSVLHPLGDKSLELNVTQSPLGNDLLVGLIFHFHSFKNSPQAKNLLGILRPRLSCSALRGWGFKSQTVSWLSLKSKDV